MSFWAQIVQWLSYDLNITPAIKNLYGKPRFIPVNMYDGAEPPLTRLMEVTLTEGWAGCCLS